MDQKSEQDYRRLSLQLARALDEYGLNTLSVKKRRHTTLCQEQMLNIDNRLNGLNGTCFTVGSQVEGTTTPDLNSDIDTLFCYNDFNVIEDLAAWKQGTVNLLMLQEDTAPGYCRLQLLDKDEPMGRQDLPPSEHFTYDEHSRILMKNTIGHSNRMPGLFNRNGPAQSSQGGPEFMDEDFVSALPCNSWPLQAKTFTSRHRLHGWPSQHLLKEATRNGVFLVPVGHKLSPVEPLEWRISASLAERCLMFSLNIAHIKCLVVLKFLMKLSVKPPMEKCISSYHCKTALLYCTENTEPAFWREENLVQCVIRCLEMLRQWVSDLFCPQFMISKENLFTGKVTVDNRDLLRSILTKLIENDLYVTLKGYLDGLGQILQKKMNAEPSFVPVTNSLQCVMLIGKLEYKMQQMLNAHILNIIINLGNIADRTSVTRAVYQDICKLQAMAKGSEKHARQAIKSFIMFLSCWLGSLVASSSLFNKKMIPCQAIQLMNTAAKNDPSSILKVISILYSSGKYRKAEEMLQKVKHIFSSLCVTCMCYMHVPADNLDCYRFMHVLKGAKARAMCFAHCVRFSLHELHCVPPALHNELYRAVGDDKKQRKPMEDDWMLDGDGPAMEVAVVDCLPYMYFLQYLTYARLEKHDLRKQSLRNLDQCVREIEYLPHRETAWNLLGQCWESEQKPEVAMDCYRASLEIRPRNNAANWHVAILWYNMIKNLGLISHVESV